MSAWLRLFFLSMAAREQMCGKSVTFSYNGGSHTPFPGDALDYMVKPRNTVGGAT